MSLLPKCLSLRSLNLYALSRLALKLDAKFKLYCPGISLIHIITIIQFHRCSLQELRSSITSEVFGSLWCPGKKYWVSSVISGQPNLMQTTNGYNFDSQNLSDEGLSCISKCKNLESLNLTW